MKIALKIAGGIAGFLVVVLLVIYLSLNVIIARAITSFGPALTQTPVSVTLVSMSPFSGGGRVIGLTIDSPQGYHSQPAIKLGDVTFKVNLRSLLSQKVIIEEIVIDSSEVNFEQKLTTNNISTLRSNVNSYASKFSGSAQNRSARRFQINRLIVTNAQARIGTGGAMVLFPMANVDRSHIGARSQGVTSAEMTRIVFTTFADSVLKSVASGALLKQGAGSISEGIKGIFGN